MAILYAKVMGLTYIFWLEVWEQNLQRVLSAIHSVKETSSLIDRYLGTLKEKCLFNNDSKFITSNL